MKYYRTRYIPSHPEKYVGNVNNIIARSSWELHFMQWCDRQSSVLRWASEEVIIPYVSPVDGEIHRYFPDFLIEVKKKNGDIQKILVEIKPSKETNLPEKKRNNKRYIKEAMTYAVNQAKWKAADAWAKRHKIVFQVITENELGI